MIGIALLDFGGLWWTHWHASADEGLSAAADTTIGRVRQWADEYDHFAICLDSPSSFRKQRQPEYKANRPPKPRGAIEQMHRVVATLEADGLHTFGADGFEADDVIATFVGHLSELEDALQDEACATIISCDKDLIGQLRLGVEILKFSTGERVCAEDAEARYGVAPPQWAEFQALTGDRIDGIKGVPGCGPKTAAGLLEEFHTLEEIFDTAKRHPTRFGGRKKLLFNLQDNRDRVFDNLELVELRTDVPINVLRILEPVTPKERVAIEIIPPPPPPPEAIEMTDSQPQPLTLEVAEAIEAEGSADVELSPEYAAILAAKAAAEPSRAMVPAGNGQFARQLEPAGMRQALWISQQVCESRLYQRKFKGPSEVLVAILAGRERGLGVIGSLQAINVIQGAPAFSAHAIVAFAKAHPDCEYFMLLEGSAEQATYETKRRGTPSAERLTYTIDEAKLSGCYKSSGPWGMRPAAMLRKQAGCELARAVYPDATQGLYCPEELTGEEL